MPLNSMEWLTLFHTPTLSSISLRKLIESLGSPECILGATAKELRDLGLEPETITEVLACSKPGSMALKLANADRQWLQQDGNHLLTISDPDYPVLLKQISSPPPLLFVSGQLAAINIPQIAIVGSRNCSVYGREVAGMLARQLSEAGLSVCSGLATGIDTAAHQATVSAGNTTVAILGHGMDLVYPHRNQPLAAGIRIKGALVSEFPKYAAPMREFFPQRNRIISGMSLGVIVVEAALRSGSLITARLAMEQNRDVFAVPGSIRNSQSRGCHKLIRDGAVLVESAEDVLLAVENLLRYQCGVLTNNLRSLVFDSVAGVELTAAEKEIYQYVDSDPVALDVLALRSGRSYPELQSVLLELELKNQITLCAGGYVRR